MSKMLKQKDRLLSKQSVEEFIKSRNISVTFTSDIMVHSSSGNGFYFRVPCEIIREEYPNAECSYSINVLWSKSERHIGAEPIGGFPSYPSYAEYKSYFNRMRFQERLYLEFRNSWKEDVAIYLFLHDSSNENQKIMIRIAEMWEKYHEQINR